MKMKVDSSKVYSSDVGSGDILLNSSGRQG
jgi:hypothetical protein